MYYVFASVTVIYDKDGT